MLKTGRTEPCDTNTAPKNAADFEGENELAIAPYVRSTTLGAFDFISGYTYTYTALAGLIAIRYMRTTLLIIVSKVIYIYT
jgi:hypothetical protein